jgi:hypothetical protein
VDTALADMGVPFKFSKFQWSGLPVKLPSPDDFPSIGWVNPEDVQTINAALGKSEYTGTDSHVREVISTMKGWFRNAASKGWGLVSYYH